MMKHKFVDRSVYKYGSEFFQVHKEMEEPLRQIGPSVAMFSHDIGIRTVFVGSDLTDTINYRFGQNLDSFKK